MTKTAALEALRAGNTLTADMPDRYEGVLAAHLIPEGNGVLLRRYLGESEWMPERRLAWHEIETWTEDDWQEWR